jgi:hypothetical protein
MIPVGYMYKSVSQKPDWLKTEDVTDIYSVSNCVSEDFSEWINYWKHNGYWFFDNPKIINDLAEKNNISLKGMKLFFYYAYEKQCNLDDSVWSPYEVEKSFSTNVLVPKILNKEGYDIVSFSCQTSAECSPLSCNHMAQEIKVNEHCLLSTFNEAKECIDNGMLNECEPGPYRIFEVYSVENA